MVYTWIYPRFEAERTECAGVFLDDSRNLGPNVGHCRRAQGGGGHQAGLLVGGGTCNVVKLRILPIVSRLYGVPRVLALRRFE